MKSNIDRTSGLLKVIASNIVYFRKKSGITQDELAVKANIDRTYIGYLENAKHNITIGKLADIAQALSVDVADLIKFQPKVLQEQSDIDRINTLFPFILEYQELASKYDINDVFQDNGGKHLQMLLITGLKNIGAREGNDAIDGTGKEYELKSVNSLLTQSFSTHHHLNPVILRKYRKVNWIFAIYHGIEIQEIYLMTPKSLDYYFKSWKKKWEENKKDINNPKIPLKFVKANGKLIFKIPANKQLSTVSL